MSRRSVRARSSQIFAGLKFYNTEITLHNDRNGQNLPPHSYWKQLLQSYHERIDKSYWLSIGRGDLYADAIFQLQNCLEKLTLSLMYDVQSVYDGLGKFWEGHQRNIRLFPTLNDLDDEEELPIFLYCDPKLLSRWKALFYVMAGNNYWVSFEVKNIELPKILMDEFTAAMNMRTTFFPEDGYSLTFENNNLGSGMLSLKLLKELTVTNNIIGQVPTISNQLRKLDLSGSDTGGDPLCLSTLLSSFTNLHKLLLNSMPLGVTITNDCLGCNPPLQLLELKSNQLGDETGEVLAASLQTNTNLKTLSLHGNNFSKVSVDAFTKAICNNDDLNTVIDSNHTCTVRGVTEEIEGLQCPMEEKKFISIKPDGASFIDVPLELMPVVLAWLQSVPNDEAEEDGDIYVLPNATSFMFDALRSYWDLPSLFVGRHQPEEVKMCLRDMISTVSNEEEIVCGQSFHQALLPPRKHGEYDAVLPRTNKGLLLNIGELEQYMTHAAFLGYRSFPDGSKGPAEIFTLVKQYGDVITAVNGISTIDKSFKETLALIMKANLPFFHMRLESRGSFLRPVIDSIQVEYDNCYRLSVKIRNQAKMIQQKYDALIMSQNEEVQEGCVKSERLKRLHTRAQTRMKNDLQQARDTFAAAERNRGRTWSQLTKIRDHLR